MAVAHVQNPATYARSTGATSVNLSFGTTPTVGNRALVVAHQWSSGTKGISVPTDNQGNTYTEHVETSDAGDQRASHASAQISTASGTFTVTQGFASTSWCAVMILEKSGIDHSSPVVTTNGSNGSSTTASSGSVTPNSADDLCIASVSHEGTAATITVVAGSNFTQRVEIEDFSSGQPSNIAERQATGAQQCQWTLSSTAGWIASICVYKASGGAVSRLPINNILINYMHPVARLGL